MRILAIDLGKFKSVSCLFDTQKDATDFQTFPSDPTNFRALVQAEKPDLVVFEACSMAGWVAEICQHEASDVLVASPLEDAWSWKNVKRKTDRDDALKIAKLAALKQITPVHVPSQQCRQFRSLIVFRKRIVGQITRIKNHIRSTMLSMGLNTETGQAAWSHAGLEELRATAKNLEKCDADELWKGQLRMDLDQLTHLQKQLRLVDAKLREVARKNQHVEKMMSITGVGQVAAQTIAAWIDDPKRFRNGRQVAAYAGLVPRRYQSGNMDRSGRISKRGPKWLRTALVEAAWIVVRHNAWARDLYQRVHRGQKTRKKQAIVAVARKLLVRCWAMMRSNQTWAPPTPSTS